MISMSYFPLKVEFYEEFASLERHGHCQHGAGIVLLSARFSLISPEGLSTHSSCEMMRINYLFGTIRFLFIPVCFCFTH